MLSASTLEVKGAVGMLWNEMRYQPGFSLVSCQVTMSVAPGSQVVTWVERLVSSQGKMI